MFWPDEGYTKGELCEYYAAIADTLLPYLRDRPVLMVRYPDGIAGKHFFQWNVPAGTPDWVRGFSFARTSTTAARSCRPGRRRDTLLYLANLGCIPLHILASRADDLESCDFLTIDFDVGDAPFAHAIELARALHELLDQIGLTGFPKTSGQTGLHVLVPLGGVPFARRASARRAARPHPARAPSRHLDDRAHAQAKRPNAVYIDTGQTGRSRAIVAPYSVRAYRRRARVDAADLGRGRLQPRPGALHDVHACPSACSATATRWRACSTQRSTWRARSKRWASCM